MTIGCLLAVALTSVAGAANKDNVSEVRKVDSFSSIEITSAATIYFTQDDNCSLRIEGKEEFVNNTSTTVEGGCLVIDFREKEDKKMRENGVTLYLTAPDLKKVSFTGVGGFNCEEPLKLDEVLLRIGGVGEINIADLTCHKLKVKLEGVGEANIHVNCDYLSAGMSGVGSVKLSGTAGDADISKGGIGSVNTKELVVINK